MPQATGTFDIHSWDELTWDGKKWNEVSGAKLTHAKTTQTFSGDLEGKGESQSLTVYLDDTHADYVGLLHVTGTLAGRSGSFTMSSNGTYADGVARTTWTVIPGSATSDLRGLRGTGGFDATHGMAGIKYRLDYEFEA